MQFLNERTGEISEWDPETADPTEETADQLAIHLFKNALKQWSTLTDKRLIVIAERLHALDALLQTGQVIQFPAKASKS